MHTHIANPPFPAQKTSPFASARQRGFSLVEMAIVLVIVGMLVTGGLALLATQQEIQRIQTTNTMLDTAKEELLGFAAANGRLPCPASAASNGFESFCTNAHPAACGAAVVVVTPGGAPLHGRCTNPWDGFLPAASLGFTPVDGNGYGVDAWGTPLNRIRYAVTDFNTGGKNSFTATDQMKTTGTAGGMAFLFPDLVVCSSATGITATTCGAGVTTLTNNAAAVIFSLGKNTLPAAGIDETANTDINQTYVSHTPTNPGAANGEFDDLVTWLSPNVLYNRMLSAGKLP